MKVAIIILITALLLTACTVTKETKEEKDLSQFDTAIFAGGCFWCIEAAFEYVDGVQAAVSGYSGGHTQNPTYYQVTAGGTGHFEAVLVYYDKNTITYKQLLDVFWRNIDPTDDTGQFADKGSSYRTAIFYANQEEKKLAEQSKKELEESDKFDKPIVTQILPRGEFYQAEEYHQDYSEKNPFQYELYKKGSGRSGFFKQLWGQEEEKTVPQKGEYQKPSDKELQEKLTPLQYKVTQKDGTERPFDNEYWDNTKEGIYVDIVSGEPLFSSKDKFKSGTGWPSFTKPLAPENIVEKEDRKLFVKRTEIRSKNADSHLGHVFNDGPAPTGQRYCMNSAALRFIAKEDLEKEGYGKFSSLFD